MTQKTEALEKKQNADRVEQTRDMPVYVPDTDIYETGEAVVVVADMPGVDEKHVDVDLEQGVLTITGSVEPERFEGYQLVVEGYRPGNYRRSFTLSNDVDVDGISARIKDGVLRIRLPKAKELRPRKIQVECGQ
jgi:HSP20 family protein